MKKFCMQGKLENYCRTYCGKLCFDEKVLSWMKPKKLKEFKKKEMQRYSRKMCGIPGNSIKRRKVKRAVMYAFIPMLWDKVYSQNCKGRRIFI